jgi:quercetin dioxygenase-like cupin family protein
MIEKFYELIPIATERGDYATISETHGYVDVAPNGNPIAAIIPDEPIKYLTILEFEKGVPRGNHVHTNKYEFIVPISGTLRAKLWLPNSPNDKVEITLHRGQILHILPNCAHSVTAIDGDATAIEYSPQACKDYDTIRFKELK